MDDMLSKAFDPETPFTADLNAKVGNFLRVNVTQKFCYQIFLKNRLNYTRKRVQSLEHFSF